MDLRNSLLARGAQRRQVVRDRRPDLAAVDLVVFVPQAIANAADVPPRLIRRQLLRQCAEFLGRLADAQQAVLSRIKRLGVGQELLSDMSAV